MRSVEVGLLAAIPLTLGLLLGPTSDAQPSSSGSEPPEGDARQGLVGHYYTPHLRDDWPDYRGLSEDAYGVSTPAAGKQPNAVRIDPQIAFGKGVGFASSAGSPVVWWPEEVKGNRPGAVIWQGYIRLPKAGTYYLTMASHGASAIYLNQIRVALKGYHSGGTIATDAFSYPETDAAEQPINPQRWQYLVPITIDAPRSLPLEVRFRPHATGVRGHRLVGIDLYWVTPDSPRDEEGKPIAEIVPAEVLFADPPGPIAGPTTRAETSTISSDFLYFPAAYSDDYFTLTIRLADEKGRPVAGKRVHVSGLVSYGRADEIVQPEQPTDENGITTALVRAGPGYKVRHESTFHAADITDFVDVGQVAHVNFITSSPTFLPLTYAPYYDDKAFLVEPTPLRLGSPARITIPLENRNRRPAELTVTFLTQEHNIGGARDKWGEIGKAENVRLEPGETREVSVEWTPQVDAYACFKVEVFGRYLTAGADAADSSLSFASFLPQIDPVRVVFASQSGGERSGGSFESVQRNVGRVRPPSYAPSEGMAPFRRKPLPPIDAGDYEEYLPQDPDERPEPEWGPRTIAPKGDPGESFDDWARRASDLYGSLADEAWRQAERVPTDEAGKYVEDAYRYRDLADFYEKLSREGMPGAG